MFQGGFIHKDSVPEDYLTILHKELMSLPYAELSGALTSFVGVVRESSDQGKKKVVRMEVEHWEEKGKDVMTEITVRIGKKYGLLGLRLFHVYGNLEIGDPIVFVAISSKHRKEAFLALEETINAYKNESPVWKKEIYTDGTSHWIRTAH